MMKKNKKKVGLLSGLLLLGLLGGIYWGVNRISWEEEKESETLSFFQTEMDEIQAIQVESGTTAYSLEKDGETWICPELGEDGEADQDRIESLAAALSDITAVRKLTDTEEEEELERYGLHEPSLRITLELSDGSIRELCVGDTASDGHDYARVTQDGTVYTIYTSLRSTFDIDPESLRAEEEAEEETEDTEEEAEEAEEAGEAEKGTEDAAGE